MASSVEFRGRFQDSESVSDLSLEGYGASWRSSSESPLWPETNAPLGKVNEHIIEIGYDRASSLRYLQHPAFRASLKRAAMQPHMRCSTLPTCDLHSERHRFRWLNRIEANTNG